jgi:hypothetical protein
MKKVTSILLAVATHIICQCPNAKASEILFDSAHANLEVGDIDGQGPWKIIPAWGGAYVKSIGSGGPAITSLPDASDKVGARASLSTPVTGEKPVVVSFSLLRGAGDFLQIGVGSGKGFPMSGFPVSIFASGLSIGVRDSNLGALTPGFRADGQKVAPYGVWLDVRAVFDPTSNTVSIKIKNASEPDSAFVDLYTSDKHDITGFTASVSTSLRGADELFLRLPGSNSVTNPNDLVTAIRNIVVSEE